MHVVLLAVLLGAAPDSCPELLDHEFRPLAEKQSQRLCERFDKEVLLVVNTASECGFTPQYEGLEELYKKYQDRGFAVIGFPSNDFAGQEPGDEDEIKDFCRTVYGIEFPMFEKISVRGQTAHPFYRSLAATAGTEPKWNFHKYLIGRDGQVIAEFPSRTKPNDPELINALDTALQAN